MGNKKLKIFKPNLKDQIRVANIIAKKLSKNKGLKLSNNQIIIGTKKK